ncbi:hypothetical protein OK348_05150 [Flavobacterium sp. MXW15]|uniref:DUF1963 domain-containing protein n=1 Tax=Xanthomonas chitinilytica TaxID=2989819 RepID=A0ABT3JT94_9XANT|nr:hypothetical protein [Xanthomonas sp. H13-6]MCW4454175.1 hypothetical protein [Flavobacterium sp. MXW15]MCW4471409.1 hypothetical protein [Xanthomonas sp. H13-6]
MRWPWSASPPRLDDPQAEALLQALTSRDARRIQAAASQVARLHAAGALDALAPHAETIGKACAGIELDGALIGNQVHLAFALRRLRYWRDRTGCLCALYPGYVFFDPRCLIEQGQVRLLERGEAEDGWGERHRVACSACGQAWDATDREYHYPWWEWRPLPAA